MEVSNLDKRRQEQLKELKEFTLLDDTFMTKVFEDKECTEVLLRAILGVPDLKVEKSESQASFRNLQHKSIRLDVFATDTEGRVYNIEIQRADKKGFEKRVRYYCSLIDSNITYPGEEYENLLEKYVIFILEEDPFKGGYQVYHIGNVIKELQKPFEDGVHILAVNVNSTEENDLSRLLKDFKCTDAKEMKCEPFARRTYELKETEKGKTVMCRAMERMCNEAEVRGEVKAILNEMERRNIGFQEAMECHYIPATNWPMYAEILKDLKAEKAEREKQLVH